MKKHAPAWPLYFWGAITTALNVAGFTAWRSLWCSVAVFAALFAYMACFVARYSTTRERAFLIVCLGALGAGIITVLAQRWAVSIAFHAIAGISAHAAFHQGAPRGR